MNNIEDGYYISPSFLDKMSIHVAKNFLDLPKIKVPLILGIWGGKGQGKTFQCALAYKKLGIAPIVMSAGELESGNAGEPAKLIRQRYREASDVIRKGKMCSLFINDLDAGAGRMGRKRARAAGAGTHSPSRGSGRPARRPRSSRSRCSPCSPTRPGRRRPKPLPPAAAPSSRRSTCC